MQFDECVSERAETHVKREAQRAGIKNIAMTNFYLFYRLNDKINRYVHFLLKSSQIYYDAYIFINLNFISYIT